jgi:hypothetical protein
LLIAAVADGQVGFASPAINATSLCLSEPKAFQKSPDTTFFHFAKEEDLAEINRQLIDRGLELRTV